MVCNSITQQLRSWLRTHGRGPHVDQIEDDELLLKAGHIDSLGVMSLITYVESLLGREIPDELMSFDNFESLQRIQRVFFAGEAR